MATATRPRHTIAPQLEISVHRRSTEEPVTGRLELVQARELIGRLSLMDSSDPAVATAMKGNDPSRLLLGIQAFYRLILEQGGCVALAASDGSLWTIPARAVDAIDVRLVTGVAGGAHGAGPASMRRGIAASGEG